MEPLIVPPFLRSTESWKLDTLAARLGGTLTGATIPVDHLVVDSRLAKSGALFFAIKGTNSDGHTYLEQFVAQGGSAVVVSSPRSNLGCPAIVVDDTQAALSTAARLFAGDPARALRCIGITGTNGKSTTNWLLYHLLRAHGEPSMRIGTLGIVIDEQCGTPDSLTTPDPIALWNVLDLGVRRGVRNVVMEVSSHALHQRRVDDVPFSVGIFTNLTHDHLDYHGSFDAYFHAKMRLFDLLSEYGVGPRTAVVNLDSSWGARVIAHCKERSVPTISFGTVPEADLHIAAFEQNARGSKLVVRNALQLELETPFIGTHNSENLCAALGALFALGVPMHQINAAFAALPDVPGRLQRVGAGMPITFVDYAHTPDALERALMSLRPLVGSNRLWVVFGCGGDRDKTKRPIMAAVAEKHADHVVITSDNPRTEDPLAILAEIQVGLARPAYCEVDRSRAIAYTLAHAAPQDLVLIAGKGHEEYQIIGKEKRHFSDFEEAQRFFQGSGHGTQCVKG